MKRKAAVIDEAYETMTVDHPQGDRCWACGCTKDHKPRWWYSDWFVQRAHICNKPRLQDRRAVVLLDPACHFASHGSRYREWKLPKLTLANLLFLKQQFDPEYFDLAFLQKCSVRILPEPEPLPDIYRAEYAKRHDPAFMESIRDEIHARAEQVRTSDPVPVQLPNETDGAYLTRLAERGKGAM